MHFLHQLEEALRACAETVPLELYTFFGAIVEEVIAPIPSPLIMASAGSVAFAQHKTYLFLIWLSLVGAVGKTVGAWIVYFISDKLEDVVVGKFGRFFGVSHKEVEDTGKHFSGGWRDGLILFVLRLLPIVPSSPVSVAAGVIKIDLRTYLAATFGGNFFRNFIYIYIGFGGIGAYESLLNGLDNTESIVQMVMVVLLLSLVAWIYYKRSKGRAVEWVKSKFFK